MDIRRLIIGALLLFFLFPHPIYAQENSYIEARVESVVEEGEIELFDGTHQKYQRLQLLPVHDNSDGTYIYVDHGKLPATGLQYYEVGDRVLVASVESETGDPTYYITDTVRRRPLVLLFLLFIIVAIAIARKRAVGSLIGMALSFVVIFTIILPGILDGQDPLTITLIGSSIIVFFTFFLSHGANAKTALAVGGTFVTLILVGILARVSIPWTHLTGYASEEASFLQSYLPGATINMRGVLLSGIIMSLLGILDDVTISQVAIVEELKKTDIKLTGRTLYKKAMNIGRDHIASVVNTLVLVYAGASLPLLLLFVVSERSYNDLLNMELIAEEVVQMLVGSIGLMLAVPITTIIAAYYYGELKESKK